MNQSKEPKKARPAHRPTKYRKEFCKKIIEFASRGITTINLMAEALDCHKDSLYEWAKQHKEFSDALRRARQLQKMNFEKFYIASMTGQHKGANTLLVKYFATAQLGWKEEPEDLDESETTVEFQYE